MKARWGARRAGLSERCGRRAEGREPCETAAMVRRRLALGLISGAALALALTGCASDPTMRIHHAELRSASFYGVGLDMMLQVYNPNSYDIQIRNVRANVVISGRYSLPPLVFSPNQWLPAGEKTLVRVPMLIPYMLVPRLIDESVYAPIIYYSVNGSVDVTAVRMLGVEKDNYPINEQSSITRQALMAAAGRSMPF